MEGMCDGGIFNFPDTIDNGSLSRSIAVFNSEAQCDDDRDKVRSERLKYGNTKQFSSKSATSINVCPKYTWKNVTHELIRWRPEHENADECDTPYIDLYKPCRTLLFHVSEVLYVNECGFDFLGMSEI